MGEPEVDGPMRVLAVGNMYPPHHLGGYELIWQSAVRDLRRRGHEVRVLTADFARPGVDGVEDPDVSRELRWYWHDHEFPRLGIRECLRLERHNASVLARHLDALAPHVVSWWAMGGMSLSLIEQVRRAGLPSVGFVIDDWMVYGPLVDQGLRRFAGSPLRRALARRVRGAPAGLDLGGAARWVFVSEATRRNALRAGVDLADTAVLHAGVDGDTIRPPSLREWRWRLLYFGRIDERKGIDTAIHALAELPHEARLTIIGDGDERYGAALREAARERGVEDRVAFEPGRPRAELVRAIDECDAVVFPVRWAEPWGLVPLEAMARSTPVVATGTGGSGEYLRDGENSLLFEAGDPVGLAACLRRLAEDAQLRSQVVNAGVRTARQHTEGAYNDGVAAELERAAQASRT